MNGEEKISKIIEQLDEIDNNCKELLEVRDKIDEIYDRVFKNLSILKIETEMQLKLLK